MVRNISRKEEDKINDEYRNSSSECPPGGLFISNTFDGVELNRDGGLFQAGGGGVFKFSKHDGINFSQRSRIHLKVENLNKSWRSCLIEDLQYMNFTYLNCAMKKLRFG